MMTAKEKHDALAALRCHCAPFNPADPSFNPCTSCPYTSCSPDLLLAALRDLLLDVAPDDPRAQHLVSAISYCLDNVYSPFCDSDNLDSICSSCSFHDRCNADDHVVIPEDVYALLCDLGVYDGKTCKLAEEAADIVCSECGVRMNDEIYYMFSDWKKDFNYCPCCGSKIIHGKKE